MEKFQRGLPSSDRITACFVKSSDVARNESGEKALARPAQVMGCLTGSRAKGKMLVIFQPAIAYLHDE